MKINEDQIHIIQDGLSQPSIKALTEKHFSEFAAELTEFIMHSCDFEFEIGVDDEIYDAFIADWCRDAYPIICRQAKVKIETCRRQSTNRWKITLQCPLDDFFERLIHPNDRGAEQTQRLFFAVSGDLEIEEECTYFDIDAVEYLSDRRFTLPTLVIENATLLLKEINSLEEDDQINRQELLSMIREISMSSSGSINPMQSRI